MAVHLQSTRDAHFYNFSCPISFKMCFCLVAYEAEQKNEFEKTDYGM